MSRAKVMSEVKDMGKVKGVSECVGRAGGVRSACRGGISCAGRGALGSVAVRGFCGSVMSFRSGGYRFDLGIGGRVVGFVLL